MELKGKKIILASNSPRRKELLAGLDVEFSVDTRNNFEEVIPCDADPSAVPTLMSEGKSGGFWRELTDDEILVTADTMVVCDGEMMGKPHGKEEAEHMLRTLSGREHQVITAVTVRDNKRRKTVSDCANVWFKNLTDSEISYYIGKWKPFDKAGAYGIQEWIGYIGIERIEGSFFNIMGLPVHLLYSLLLEFVG